MKTEFTTTIEHLHGLMRSYGENYAELMMRYHPALHEDVEDWNQKVAFHLTMIEAGHAEMLDQTSDEYADALEYVSDKNNDFRIEIDV